MASELWQLSKRVDKGVVVKLNRKPEPKFKPAGHSHEEFLAKTARRDGFVETEGERLFPGIGPKSGEMLRAAGIVSLARLRELGSVGAYVMVKRAGGKPSLNFLWGLESLVTGEHWRDVARKHRASLLLALEEAERNG